MTTRHLTALLAATMVLAVGTTAALIYARRVEARYVHTLGNSTFAQTTLGAALQTEAFRQPDLLPLYGSSEIVRDNPFHGRRLFVDYPTGFQIFPVASLGATPLMYALRLAGVGSTMRGRKVVVSIGPTSIYHAPQTAVYAGNFSRLQATALVFSLELPYELRQAAARRLIEYPTTLASDALLRTAIRSLVDESLKGRALYTLLIPLGKLQESILRVLDHWEILAHMREGAHRSGLHESRVGRGLDWPTLTASAQRVAEKRSSNNPFGFDNTVWRRYRPAVSAKRRTKSPMEPPVRHVASLLTSSDEANWKDLDLLFGELKSFGAQPLVLSAPFCGRYYDFWGIGEPRRRPYYDTVREIASRHDVPILDFEDHDQDIHFVIDTSSHISAKGWIYYARAIDEFFHDQPLTQAREELRQ